MANFEPIVEWLLYQEDDHRTPGKIVNLGDGAGLTRLGITSKNYSTVMDSSFWTTMPFSVAVPSAKTLYENQYWHHINGDRINDDQTAALILSWSVNRNVPVAVKGIQTVLGVEQDGVLGLVTIAELNSKDPAVVAAQYRAEWKDFYSKVVSLNPDDARFLDGWNARVDFPFPSPLVGSLYA
jgi:lysozyme family protein